MRALALVKPVMVFIALVAAILLAGGRLLVSLRETQPTAYAVQTFAQEYRGETWLALAGVLAFEHQTVREANPSKGTPNRVRVYTPLVAPGWQPGDPVHVILESGPGERTQVEAWVKQHRPGAVYTVTGTAAPGGRNSAILVPHLRVEEPAIYLMVGDEPVSPWGLAVFLAIMAVCLPFNIWTLWRTIRA